MSKERVVYMVIDVNGNDVMCIVDREVARQFEREHPEVKVERSIVTPAPREKGGA